MGLETNCLYFVIVSLVTVWTTPFAISSGSGRGVINVDYLSHFLEECIPHKLLEGRGGYARGSWTNRCINSSGYLFLCEVMVLPAAGRRPA
jgi:hypothetical protein